MTRLSLRTGLGALAAAALLLAACGDSPEPGAPEPAAPEAGPAEDAMATLEPAVPVISSGWVRTPPAGRDVTAGYVTLLAENEDDQLINASSPIATRVELHTMEDDGEVMRMRQVEAIDLPAGVPVYLRPGGDHLMFFGVDTAALDGEVDVVLDFASGAQAHVRLPLSATEPQPYQPSYEHEDAHQRGDYHEPVEDEGEEG